MQDRYRKRYRVPAASGRLRQQIALEAARRLYKTLIPPVQEPPPDWLDAATLATSTPPNERRRPCWATASGRATSLPIPKFASN